MSDETNLSIIILVIGRRREELSLYPVGELAARTLQSLRDQGLTWRDEVLCAVIGDYAEAQQAFYNAGLSGKILRVKQTPNQPVVALTGETLAAAEKMAKPTNWVLFCRDGDAWTPGIIEPIRAVLHTSDPSSIHIFHNSLCDRDGPHAGTIAVHPSRTAVARFTYHRGDSILHNHIPPEVSLRSTDLVVGSTGRYRGLVSDFPYLQGQTLRPLVTGHDQD